MTTRIVCTEQPNCHIVAVGTNPDGGDNATGRMTVPEVWAAIDRGETFYTWGGGKVALVHKFHCACGRGSLRSAADSTVANNLDYMRTCAWRAA